MARVRVLYERITQTRYTALYFLSAFLTCFLLGSFQILGLSHDSEAVSVLSTFVQQSNSTVGLVLLKDDTFELCSGLPNESGATCKAIAPLENGSKGRQWGSLQSTELILNSSSSFENDEYHLAKNLQTRATNDKSGDKLQGIGEACYVSLRWLNDILQDDQREDVVTFLFQIWLFVLSFITIMNESLPHLGAALFGNMLSTAWAGYRVYSTYSLMNLYRSDISLKACEGHDLMGTWWEARLSDTIPLVVCDGVAFLVMAFLSFKLYKVYDYQTTLRVEASPKVLRIYKLVLTFSVFLQLSGFISFASTGLWVDKVAHGSLAEFAHHTKLYLAVFVIILVTLIPWLVFGWICVRKECSVRFTLFCLMSLLLLGTSIAMFASDLYRYIFSTWPFFATITVTSFLLTTGTTVLGVVCRLNFGLGLAHYIQVNEALEGVDFTPIHFNKPNTQDIEKSSPVDTTPDHQSLAPPRPFQSSQPRGDSIYSDFGAAPIVISASPPLTSDLAVAANAVELSGSPKRTEMPIYRTSVNAPRKNPSLPSEVRIVTADESGSVVVDLESARKDLLIENMSKFPSISEVPSTIARGNDISSTRTLGSSPGLPAHPRARVPKFEVA